MTRPVQWDRREWITTALGATAWAMVGCRRESLPPLPPGDLVGAAVELGHAVRDAVSGMPGSLAVGSEALLSGAVAEVREVEVLIVGGGVAGLCAANRLLELGQSNFAVLELEPRWGGTATGEAEGERSRISPVPWGAHYLPAPTKDNERLVKFLEGLGAFDGEDEFGEPRPREEWSVRAPESRFFFRGSWYDGLYAWPGASQEDLAQRSRFQEEVNAWVVWRDAAGRRAFTLPADRGSDDELVRSLDRITMAEWMRQRGFDSERLWSYVDYACRDDYGTNVEGTSAWAGLFYFAARRTQIDMESRPYLTWPEGNGFLTRTLAERIGERGVKSTAVIQVIPGEAETLGSKTTVLTLDSRGSRQMWRADRVIFAAPQMLAPFVIAGYRDAEIERTQIESTDSESAASESVDVAVEPLPATRGEAARAFQYGAWVVANLHLDRAPREEGVTIAWDNVIHDSASLGYLATSRQRGRDHGPAVWTWYYPICDVDPTKPRRRLLDAGREVWAEIALSDLERAHPDLRERVERIDVMRWGHAMITPRPGFRFSAARQLAAKPWRGIWFAHSDLSGLPLFEEAFERGQRAAEEVMASLSMGASRA